MRIPIGGRWAGIFLCALLTAGASGLRGQTAAVAPADTAATDDEERHPWEFPIRRPKVSFGIRARTFPMRSLSVMGNQTSLGTAAENGTVVDRHGNITSRASRMSGGPVVEILLGEKLKLRTELLYTRLGYDNVTNTFSGVDNPATNEDERTRSTVSENTRARLFDIPVVLQYGKLTREGLLSRVFFTGGAAVRTVSKIRSSTRITAPDGEETSHQISASPRNRNVLGGVVGIGFRFIDDFSVNVTPEFRFTRWAGPSFQGAPLNQFEFGIGISY